MQHQSYFRLDDAQAREVVKVNPWALLVAAADDGHLDATPLPVLLDETVTEGLAVLAHTARVDPATDALLAGREVLLVFQGPNGYLSPSWYGPGTWLPTWNFVAVHARGVADVVEGAEALDVLRRTVARFEEGVEGPWELGPPEDDLAHRLVAATCCFYLRATDIRAKAKMSQDKPIEVRDGVIGALRAPGPHHNPELAAAMQEARRRD